MSIQISLEGLSSPGGNEERSIALLDVLYNDVLYKWKVYIPSGADLATYLTSIEARIETEISTKEAAWAALEPKTRLIDDLFGGGTKEVPIAKEEIVRPDMPDYYALRRNKYPPVEKQVAAILKGTGSPDAVAILAQIEAVKAEFPKPLLTPEERQQELIDGITRAVQSRLDTFAGTRGYDSILSACTYENSDNVKFSTEAKYCIKVRGDTWATLYQIMGDVMAGNRPVPSSYSEIEVELPPLTWPV